VADGAAPVQGASPPIVGEPPFDPSQNVLNVFDAGMKRQDDLRSQDEFHAREMREQAFRYQDRLDAKDLRLDAKDELIRQGEAARINAILAENAGTVQRSAEVQAAQQQALAAQVLASAEALRTAAMSAAAQQQETLRTTVAPMLTRLDELSRAQYETQGQKQQVVETRDVRGDAVAIEQARIQAAQARMQMFALVIAAFLLALGIYGAFHK
jgi:hypothetical protein